VVRGIETAIVVGPDGETIYTDDWGRVKVRFHWDRADPSPDQTCWMRVAFASADNGFGHVIMPRIGQEVVVDFLHGDPDRPIVVGSVYNGDKKPAYALAGNKTMSVWRSHTIDGGTDDYNEISFEDKNGEEVFNVQAQKDRKTLVKHDDTKTIKNNLSTTIQEGDETREVSQGKRTTTIEQDEALTVKSGNMNTTVSTGNKSTTVSTGNYTIDISAGQMTVTAAISIELKVGSSSVKIDQTGVTVKGIMIQSEAQAMLTEKAPLIQVTADGLTQIKGGIVMIN
jgi:type VI secretion system secreted protein VgrG